MRYKDVIRVLGRLKHRESARASVPARNIAAVTSTNKKWHAQLRGLSPAPLPLPPPLPARPSVSLQ